VITRDLNAAVPASLVIRFPVLSSQGDPTGAWYDVTVTLFSLGLAGQYRGNSQTQGLIRATAWYDGSNAAELNSQAEKIARAWYAQALQRYDLVFGCLMAEDLTPADDFVEIIHDERGLLTRRRSTEPVFATYAAVLHGSKGQDGVPVGLSTDPTQNAFNAASDVPGSCCLNTSYGFHLADVPGTLDTVQFTYRDSTLKLVETETILRDGSNFTVPTGQITTWQGGGTLVFDTTTLRFDTPAIFNAYFRWPIAEMTAGVDQPGLAITEAAAVLQFNATADLNLFGIAAGAAGRMLWFQNVGYGTVTIKHESASAESLTYRIQTPGGLDFQVRPGEGTALWWDGAAQRWRVPGAANAVDGSGTTPRYAYWATPEALAAAAIEEQSSRLLALKKLSFHTTTTAEELAFIWRDDTYRLVIGLGNTNCFVFDNNAKFLDILDQVNGHYRCRGNAGQTTTVFGMTFTGGILTGAGSGSLSSSDISDFAEAAQDSVGNSLTDSATIDFTYDDAGNSITAVVKDNSITPAKLDDGSAYSVLGRAGSTSGDRADITATFPGQVLRRDGGGLAFGAVNLSSGTAVSGTLGISNGGTGATSFNSRGVVFSGSSGLSSTSAGTDNQVLRSQGGGSNDPVFEWLRGEILGSNFVATEETTTSGTPTDLTTTQSITFTLESAQDVLIFAACTSYNTTASGVNTLTFDIDGTDYTAVSGTMDAASSQYPLCAVQKRSLTSGSHTIKLQFHRNSGTAGFKDRGIFVARG
jgi:hypothetical protein